MHLHERIDCLERAIVTHYTDMRGERRLGWTKLKNIKVELDYVVDNPDNWDTEYHKRLLSMVDDLRIPEGQRYQPKVNKSKKKAKK